MSKCAEIVCAILSQNTVKFAPINHEGMQQKCCSDLAGGYQRAAASSSSDIGYQDGRTGGTPWLCMVKLVLHALAWYSRYTMIFLDTVGTSRFYMVQLIHYGLVWAGAAHGAWLDMVWYTCNGMVGIVHYGSL